MVAEGLNFPLYLTAPAGDARLFIVEKNGRIRVVKEGRVLPASFLDISSEISTGSEQGLLSMAFHPDYAKNRRFFVYYTDNEGDTQVVEYRVSADPDRADPAPVRTILTVDQPFSNHNGGLVLFGPDRKLYIGLGDGGGAGDPYDNGQNLGTLLGKILRIDVDARSPYAIPADNPFRRGGARGEVWVYGLRNPWRFSFDRETGDFYVADVGQNRREEVNAVSKAELAGRNYGWNTMEGSECFEPRRGCTRSGLTLPVLDYANGTEGCSVTGGYVYRGSAVPELQGTYFFSDFCAGFVRSFRFQGDGRISDQRTWPALEPGSQVPSFGEDSAGELYLMTAEGAIFKVVSR
jgi:glucose/arabinose dehydrogenase